MSKKSDEDNSLLVGTEPTCSFYACDSLTELDIVAPFFPLDFLCVLALAVRVLANTATHGYDADAANPPSLP